MSGWTTRTKGSITLTHHSTSSLVSLSTNDTSHKEIMLSYAEMEGLRNLLNDIHISENKPKVSDYKLSYYTDVNGKRIREGDLIVLWNNKIQEFNDNGIDGSYHCVEFHEGDFGSDIRSDFDSLSTYNEIHVIGHCEHFRYQFERGKIEGNMGAVLK